MHEGQRRALAPRSLRSEKRFIGQCTDDELESANITRDRNVSGSASRWGDGSVQSDGEWPSPN
ncbi:hypothetical protein [Salinibacter phage M8CC-19]|uniref:Uncharacterized protein n=2 Tax=Kryptosalinivirus M8CC19 TaxID=2560720 RepID=A0A2I6UGG5_9CAUD|nr:hypothetical protein FGG63_gp10 [Salinibacter phage M8CC-19]AUO79016.1 hypothetical protein [Salinibacter phage M8CC-19]AUO79249.1 hypothetical protein [Salinibacter phage M31CC-1]